MIEVPDVPEEAPIAGKSLEEATGLLEDDLLVVATERNSEGEPITPRGDTRIRAGNLVTVYSGNGVTPEVTGIFGHSEDHTKSSHQFR